MKNIIVGIDFSEGSLNAMQHAVSLASRFDANLTLLFVVSPDAKVLLGTDNKSSKDDIVSFVGEKLEKLAEECKIALPNVNVSHKIRIGKASKEINAEANAQDDAFIVLGTHGCSGFQEFFVGSSAFRVVSGSSCPVLTVCHGITIERDLTDILLVIDSTLETMQKLKYVVPLAKAFQAKVHLMGLYPEKLPEIRQLVEAYINKSEVFLMENNVRFETTYVKSGGKKVDTVLSYAKANDVNLIVVMKEVELDGDNVFILAPFSERIVNRSPIPILTVPVNQSIYPKV
jgi:nucleotide-binding universal stress UspA family protein